jgi:hypothetical protein
MSRWRRSRRSKTGKSVPVQVFGRRDDEAIRAQMGPATEKRQGTKSRAPMVGRTGTSRSHKAPRRSRIVFACAGCATEASEPVVHGIAAARARKSALPVRLVHQ